MRARLADERGFTLIELLVAMVLMTIVIGATLTAFEGADKTNRRAQIQQESQDTARNGLDRIARDLRNQATPTSQIPQAVLKATGTDIVFIAVGNTRAAGSANARNLQRVRYCLNTSTGVLWWQRRTWTTATPPSDTPDTSSCPASTTWDFSQPLVDHVTNGTARPVWAFGPTGFASNDQIRTVRTTLYVDAQPNVPPAETMLDTRAVLRNQNRAPVASFVGRAVGDGHLLLIGTGSSDPEGQSLVYTWTDGGTTIPNCTQPVCDYKPSTGGARAIGLTVTDPSGLPNSAPTQSLTP